MAARIGSAFAVLLALAVSAPAQTTSRVSLDSAGAQADSESAAPAMSARGRHVVFHSEATNLVPGDTNGVDDIFLRDRRTGTTVRVSVDSTGAEGDGDSYSPAISFNGRVVAFYSAATNLVPGDANGVDDIFVHDTLSGITTRVSVDSAGGEANGASYYPSLSADGRYVVFFSLASNLVAGDTNGDSDIFRHDRSTGVTTRVSVGAGGVQAADRSTDAGVSADGNRIVFQSWASNLAAGDSNNLPDIFVRDVAAGTTVCASLTPGGVTGNLGCGYSSISGDGRIVAFNSGASNLVAADANGLTDVFARELSAGVTTLVSVGASGAQGNGMSQVQTSLSLSFDGRFVAFKSFASTLVPGDGNGAQDVFLRDRLLGTTRLASVDTQGLQATGPSSTPTISADGRFVGFYSFASNLVPGDTNGEPDVFVRRVR